MLEQILKELLEMVETANYKSNKIVELMKEIEEKDVIITEHDAVVAAKDEEIAELNTALNVLQAKYDADIAAKDKEIAELNTALNALQAKYDADMNAINEQVQELKNALGEVPKEPVE